jgi:hypothetical protein
MAAWFAGWRGARDKRGVDAIVAGLMTEPNDDDVRWLTGQIGGDEDRARWELRYARRALGLIVAQRDALEDRTASLVAHKLTAAMVADRNVAAPRVRLVERQFNERLSAYRDMMQLRGQASQVTERTGRALLMLGGAPRVTADALERAARITAAYADEANIALRREVGEPTLPPDIRPSAVKR